MFLTIIRIIVQCQQLNYALKCTTRAIFNVVRDDSSPIKDTGQIILLASMTVNAQKASHQSVITYHVQHQYQYASLCVHSIMRGQQSPEKSCILPHKATYKKVKTVGNIFYPD